MKIIESFLCGKENNPLTCEDGIFISDKMIAIIDGVTAKSEYLWNGKKSGCFAKDVLMEYLQTGVEHLTAMELFTGMDSVLRDCIGEQEQILHMKEYPRASVIVYNDIYKEVWMYGDCQCRIGDSVYTHEKKVDTLNAMLRAYHLERFLLQGMTVEELAKEDLGRVAILDNLNSQFAFENKVGQFGYPVLNGMGIEASMMKVYSVSVGEEVILASDGYPVLGTSFAESEEYLKRVLREDPMCFRMHPSTKGLQEGNVSFDDRAFCRFVV